jgi:hypothetical protein
MKIIIGGVVSLRPFAPGFAWDWLQLADGLRRLGHDVYYVEEVEPQWCVDENGQPCAFEQSTNRELFGTCMRRFGFAERACQIFNRGEATRGMSRTDITTVAKESDLLINISGHVKSDFIVSGVKRRAYFDQDPVYTQLWCGEYGKDIGLRQHDAFLTVGLNIGTPASPIPDCGFKWHGVLPAVVLDHWASTIDSSCRRFTTIASWSGYRDLCFGGEWYGGKSGEFRRFASLPHESGQECEVAMRRHHDDEDGSRLLREGGWILSEATRINDLDSYQSFIAQSRAEIGIAKNSYVKARSGWFSDRASHYLASGKPVLTQATGFERHLPVGRGILAFSTMEEAVEGITAINADYDGHCRAARDFAREYLDYRRVLPTMLEACMT